MKNFVMSITGLNLSVEDKNVRLDIADHSATPVCRPDRF